MCLFAGIKGFESTKEAGKMGMSTKKTCHEELAGTSKPKFHD
jgi:hypothetical protein